MRGNHRAATPPEEPGSGQGAGYDLLKADTTGGKKPRRSVPRRAKVKHQDSVEVVDYRYKDDKRKNNPDAGLASYNFKPQQNIKYEYDPHLDPQLVWAGKTERTPFEVETVSLHIHERISTRAILKSVRRAQRWRQEKLFAEPELPLDKRIEFYQHEMEWANRLILGDSLVVMNSLLNRELMTGKVQMIYMDPPYGIAYNSNFQPHVTDRDVRDGRDDSLTREPEQIKAYRDTWQLGVHSYLTYLRDRLLVCRELVHESGSVFVQIGLENVHRVRLLMDEVFDSKNFVGQIVYRTTGGRGAKHLDQVYNVLLWYAKDIEHLKYRQLYLPQPRETTESYDWMELPDGSSVSLTPEQMEGREPSPDGRRYSLTDLTSQGESETGSYEFKFEREAFRPRKGRHWSTTHEGMQNLVAARRIQKKGVNVFYRRFADDHPVTALDDIWEDTAMGGYLKEERKVFVVQTPIKVIERCVMMTTDSGDLVLDPTCGGGTTAYCAEKWGRRWITCDTSRVALTLARERLMTAKFDCFDLASHDRGPAAGFIYRTVPHITLDAIAHNGEIDEITIKYQPQIERTLTELNQALGKRWKELEVPRIQDAKWMPKGKKAHEAFWALQLQKWHEIGDSIRRNAKQELLYDHPKITRGAVRVSGVFTVEAIPVAVMGAESPDQPKTSSSPSVAADYISEMIVLVQKSGITFPGSRKMTLETIRPISSAGFLHAEGEATQDGEKIRVVVSFGPRHGPVTTRQVVESIRSAYMLKFDVLVLAGMVFDPEAQATIQKNPVPKLQVHLANISPDVIVGDLLKNTQSSQLFTVFGQPDVRLEKSTDGFCVRLLGVDIYDPETGEVHSSYAGQVPAWFLDEDYDGYTFRICQAFFPKEATVKNPWDKLENALRGSVDKEKIEKFRGTESLPFEGGSEKRIAVKVIDNRGNEVMIVKSFDDGKE